MYWINITSHKYVIIHLSHGPYITFKVYAIMTEVLP